MLKGHIEAGVQGGRVGGDRWFVKFTAVSGPGSLLKSPACSARAGVSFCICLWGRAVCGRTGMCVGVYVRPCAEVSASVFE